MDKVASLHGRLLNVAKQTGIEFQLLINRFAAEQFLERLSKSQHYEKFVFKGGFLLAYLIESDRNTKDLDFTLNLISNKVEETVKVINEILNISIEDMIEWKEIEGSMLKHPDMEATGVRIFCNFMIGKMRGKIQLDIASGIIEEAAPVKLKKIRYKDLPLLGSDFSILSYPAELIFAEKLQIALTRAENNTRMRDYYDMYKLLNNQLDLNLLRTCLISIFAKRNTVLPNKINLTEKNISILQSYWQAYLQKSKLKDIPKDISEIINFINQHLIKIIDHEY